MQTTSRCVIVMAAFLQPLFSHSTAAEPSWHATYSHVAVASDHQLASEAGVEMIKQGGNVVDSAVAVAFALSVVRPHSCGIGGGGFMVIWDAEKQAAAAFDFRETAPRRATRDMYIQAGSDSSERGGLAVATPGDVAGLCHVQAAFGKLSLAQVLAPAIRIAREGYPADAFDVSIQAELLVQFQQHPDYRTRFASLWDLYLNGGVPWQVGDVIESPQREVLERIATYGSAGFHAGPVAQSLGQTIADAGGLVDAQDLAQFHPTRREPLVGPWGSDQVITMPPPSSGGVALLQMLQCLDQLERVQPSLREATAGSLEFLHAYTESSRIAFADRSKYLGDSDFVEVPIAKILQTTRLQQFAQRFDPARPISLDDANQPLLPEDGGTSHFSVMDQKGNAVACTQTVNLTFGSWVVDPKYGVVLNNEMDDFTAHPGKPNAFGLIQSSANAVQPGKRPLSSMTPTIVTREGKAVLAVGGSGGPRIISGTTQVLLHARRFHLPAQEAVKAPRIHHQWFPNTLYVESSLPKETVARLESLGYTTQESGGLGACPTVQAGPHGLEAASDPRKGGGPAGL